MPAPLDYGLTFIVIILGIFTLLEAQGNLRIYILIVLAALFVLPAIGHSPAVGWISWGAKLIFGLAAYIYLKSKGFWRFGR
jgi:hypothetical protein